MNFKPILGKQVSGYLYAWQASRTNPWLICSTLFSFKVFHSIDVTLKNEASFSFEPNQCSHSDRGQTLPIMLDTLVRPHKSHLSSGCIKSHQWRQQESCHHSQPPGCWHWKGLYFLFLSCWWKIWSLLCWGVWGKEPAKKGSQQREEAAVPAIHVSATRQGQCGHCLKSHRNCPTWPSILLAAQSLFHIHHSNWHE